ncbi:MAG TPA: hypothetical protein VNN25_07960, partial [Thermoanaerobaculia bacterium]|nr:hypothetical protein [Thermoanaerobaculia bacterium]
GWTGHRGLKNGVTVEIRAMDAQLAAALIACQEDPASLPFVTLDLDLAAAARAEGFAVLP